MTKVGLRGDVDARDLFLWINTHLLNAESPLFVEHGPSVSGDCSFRNRPGQGFSAWLDVTHRNGEEIVYLPEDTTGWDQDDIDYHSEYPTGVRAMASFDTAYGYRGPNGEGCSMLHAAFIAALIERYASPRGLSVVWQNEFTGEWHEGTDGLNEFAGQDFIASNALNTVFGALEAGSR
jgi:hypothetical protein